MIVGMDMLLASPIKVLARLGTIWQEKDFLSTVLFSVGRIIGGFLLAFLIGTGMALLAGRFRIVEVMLWPYVVTIKSVPIASFIILCLIWFSYADDCVHCIPDCVPGHLYQCAPRNQECGSSIDRDGKTV